MDFVQQLDPSKLALSGTALSFLLSLFASPSYNLPIYLFGIYAQEQNEAVQSIQLFTGMLGLSFFFDIIWMLRNDQSGFIKFWTVVLLLLKIPTFLSFLLVMRQRGAQFGGLGGGDGTTVWSMPGGFTSSARDGYQTVEDETYNAPPPPRVIPKSQPNPNPPAPGAYETV